MRLPRLLCLAKVRICMHERFLSNTTALCLPHDYQPYHFTLAVGTDDDPGFKWDGGTGNNNNIPRILWRLADLSIVRYVAARELLEAPTYGGKVLDGGASGALLSRLQILMFSKEFLTDGEFEFVIEVLCYLDNRRYVLFAFDSWDEQRRPIVTPFRRTLLTV